MCKRLAPRLLGVIGALCLFFPGLVVAQDVMPDTLDWQRYFPLEIGNQWQYQIDRFLEPSSFRRWRILGDSLLDEKHYYRLETCTYDENRLSEACGTEPFFVRYDTTNANVVIRSMFTDGAVIDAWFMAVPCGLDAPFEAVSECTGILSGMSYFVSGDYGVDIVIGSDTVVVDAWKYFSSLGGDSIMLTDVGLFQNVVEFGPVTTLVYAAVGGKTYGEVVQHVLCNCV